MPSIPTLMYTCVFRRNWFSRDEIVALMNAVLAQYDLDPLDGRDYYAIFHHYWRFRAPQAVKELLHGLEVSLSSDEC